MQTYEIIPTINNSTIKLRAELRPLHFPPPASQEPPLKWGRDLQKTKPSMCSYLSIPPPERAIKEETGSLEA